MTSSEDWLRRAVDVMPGGVNSPVRAFGAVGGYPPFIASASGATLTTVDGVELIDFISSWGAVILGHADSRIVDAITSAAAGGTSFGVTAPGEVEVAEMIRRLVPSMEMMRMVNSGTEACQSAIRVARGATGRNGIVKFEGCYHGHADSFLVEAGSGLATFGEPNSPGVTPATVADTHVADFNDLGSVEAALSAGDIAAVIVEPVAGNMGVIPPEPHFLAGLRSLCDEHGTLLIFDEVMTAFRVHRGCAQARFGITPDLTCLGKIVAGGTPAAVYGGRRDLMEQVAPVGPIYQAGTLSGNPIAVAGARASLAYIEGHPEMYDELEAMGDAIESALQAKMDSLGIVGCVQRVGAMLTVFFGRTSVRSWHDAGDIDTVMFGRFFRAALDRDVLLPPSAFEAMFLSLAHEAVLESAIERLTDALEEIA